MRAPGFALLDSIERGTSGTDCAMHVRGPPTARLLSERVVAVSAPDSTESALRPMGDSSVELTHD
jgi:hypothetical protein